ncbi:hypothetical protein [Rhodonellum ikkaensis]|uniref:hypothetical protein n=1 Tax=Rhodonellum ikkaensis TaxID=336829 RepID=UPI0012681ADA|nr:hypothetical protein [Rhodonellum ikkaensis]
MNTQKRVYIWQLIASNGHLRLLPFSSDTVKKAFLFISLLWLIGVFLVPIPDVSNCQVQSSPTASELSAVEWADQHSPLVFQGHSQFNFAGKQQFHPTAFELFGPKPNHLIQFSSASTLVVDWENFSTDQRLNTLFPFHFFF